MLVNSKIKKKKTLGIEIINPLNEVIEIGFNGFFLFLFMPLSVF